MADRATYIVEVGGFIKIGRSTCLGYRMYNLQAGCPLRMTVLAIIPGVEAEGALHRRWLSAGVRGEWYHADPALVNFATQYPTAAEDRAMAETGLLKAWTQVCAGNAPRWRRHHG